MVSSSLSTEGKKWTQKDTVIQRKSFFCDLEENLLLKFGINIFNIQNVRVGFLLLAAIADVFKYFIFGHFDSFDGAGGLCQKSWHNCINSTYRRFAH